jgi:hypothetical protein
MSAVAARARPATTEPRGTLELYRDDGPLARLLGKLGSAVQLPPIFLIAAGGLPLCALLLLRREDVTEPVMGLMIGWAVLAGGISSGRPHTDRLRWAVPPALRLLEYATIVWIGMLAGADSRPAAFALLCALAFRHYDLVYRLRHQGTTPPNWVGSLALGWEGRLIGAYLLWVADLLPEGLFVAAAVFAVVFVGDAIASWRRWGRAQQQPVQYDDEEDAPE